MTLSGKRLPLLLVALFASLALIIAGCGGDGDDSAATTTAQTTATEGSDGEQDAQAGEDASEDGSDSDQPSTDKDFIAAVTDVCERAQAASAEAGVEDDAQLDENASPEDFVAELVERFDSIKKVFNEAIAELKEINPPAEHEGDYEEFIVTNERLMEMSGQAIDAFADDPDHVMSEEDMQKQQELSETYDRLLGSLGLPEGCFDSNSPS